MAEQLQQMAGPGATLRRQRLLGRPPSAEIADRGDPLPLRSLLGRESRVGLPARRHPHAARQRQLAQLGRLHLPRRVAQCHQRLRADQGRRAGAALSVVGRRPDREGPDVVLAERRRPRSVRDRDDSRVRSGDRRSRARPGHPAGGSGELQRARRARDQQEPAAAARVCAQRQLAGQPRRRPVRSADAGL